MLKIDPWNIIWTVVNLLFLYWIFKKFLFDRVMGVINQRDEMIQKQFSEAKKSQDDAESLKSDYKKKLESAKTQADQIILDARAITNFLQHLKVVAGALFNALGFKELAIVLVIYQAFFEF